MRFALFCWIMNDRKKFRLTREGENELLDLWFYILCSFSLQISVFFFFNTAVTELNLLVLFFPILQIWKVWRWTIHSNLCRKIVDKPDLRHQETETLYSEVLDLFVRRNSYPHRNVVQSLIPSALPGAEGLQSVGLWACPSAQLAVQRQRPWGQQIQILLLPTTRASGRA